MRNENPMNEMELLNLNWSEFFFDYMIDQAYYVIVFAWIVSFLLIVITTNADVTAHQTIVRFDVCICFLIEKLCMKAFGVIVSHFMKTIWRSQHNSIKRIFSSSVIVLQLFLLRFKSLSSYSHCEYFLHLVKMILKCNFLIKTREKVVNWNILRCDSIRFNLCIAISFSRSLFHKIYQMYPTNCRNI